MLETVIVMGIIALLTTMAVPSYQAFRERGDIAIAKTDIQQIEHAIERFRTRNLRFPDSLQDISMHTLEDPWGNTYRYLNIESASEKDRKRGFTGTGKDKENMRRDRNLKPINSDFDLYSVGKDGISKPQLNAKASRDDIVRAADGRYIGLGKDF